MIIVKHVFWKYGELEEKVKELDAIRKKIDGLKILLDEAKSTISLVGKLLRWPGNNNRLVENYTDKAATLTSEIKLLKNLNLKSLPKVMLDARKRARASFANESSGNVM